MTATATRELTLTQAMFDAFATLSGDDNAIHVDPEFAARTRFGRPVAHGLMLCAILEGVASGLVPEGRLVAKAVQFPAPTFADEPMAFSATLSATEGTRVTLAVEARGRATETTTCVGTLTFEQSGDGHAGR
jgi:acyl dehydratase